MDQQAILRHYLIRHPDTHSLESARRREHLLTLEREASEAPTFRRHERIHKAGNALIAVRRTVRRIEAPDPRHALR